MNVMKIGKQIEIETLNLKFKTEHLELAEQQLQEGTDDLHFRLSHFRKRILEKRDLVSGLRLDRNERVSDWEQNIFSKIFQNFHPKIFKILPKFPINA